MPLESTAIAKSSMLNFLYIPCIPLLTYLSVPAESFVILGILLGIDYFTGVLKAIIVNKVTLKSLRAVSGLFKKALVVLLVLTIALMAKGLSLNFELYLTVLVSALIISEAYSIIGNIYSIVSGKEIEEFDALSMIIKRVLFFVEKMFVFNRDKL
ncbi:MAG: phage holin family protein [Arcobacteraceae bacterium]|nr:phage holin family protein [Arcobacteraceae bacterium]